MGRKYQGPSLYWRVRKNGKYTWRAADWSVDLCAYCEHVKVLQYQEEEE